MSDGKVVIDITANDADFKKVVGALGGMAVKGVAAITAAVLGVGAAGLAASTQFNSGMANIASLMPGHIGRVNELKKTVQDMAIEFGQSTDDLSAGLYQTVSAFGDTADTADILKTNAMAAAAGVASTTDAINLTSAVTKAYGTANAEGVKHAADLALMTVRLGQTTFPELAGSVGAVTPLMKNLGGSQEELFASMAALTGVTGNASEVSTQLRGALQALMAPTDAAAESMKRAGYANGEALVKSKGMAGALKFLTDEAKRTGKPLQEFIGSIEGQTAALALTGPQAADYASKLKQMKDASGATDAAFKEQTSGVNKLGFTFSQLKQVGIVSLQVLGDYLGNTFGGDFQKVADKVKEFADSFKTNIELGLTPLQSLRGAILDAFGLEAAQRFDALRTNVENIIAAFQGAVAWVQANRAWLEPLVVGILAMVAAYKAYQVTMAIVEGVTIAVTAAQILYTTATQGALAATELIAGSTKAAAIAQGILNAVMAANPIGIVVLAIIGLVAAFVYLWKTNKGFRDFFIAAWETVKAAAASFGKVFGQVMNAAGKSIGDTIKWFMELPGNILKAVGKLDDLLHQAGVAIIRGLWNGLKAKWEEAKRWISGIADWIRDHKGPLSYDAKLLIPAGTAIMGGFNDSLARGITAVKKQVRDLTGYLGDSSAALSASVAFVPAAYSPSLGARSAPMASSSSATYYQFGDVSIPSSDPAAQQVMGDLMRLVRKYKRMRPQGEM